MVCRDLGFAFGGLMEMSYEDGIDTEPEPIASNVVICSGLEERLSECDGQESSTVTPLLDLEQAVLELPPGSRGGGPIMGDCDTDTRQMLAVVCRQFPILGAPLNDNRSQQPRRVDALNLMFVSLVQTQALRSATCM